VSQGVEGNGQAPPTPGAGDTGGQPTAAPTLDPNAPAVDLFSRSPAGAGKGQLDMPRGIARDAAGNFFVADTQNLRIEKFDKDGKFVTAFGGKGSGEGQFNPINEEGTGTGPGGVAVDKDGNVYVADTWNHRIEKFDNNGKFVMSWGSFVNIGDPNTAGDTDKDVRFYGPRGIALGPDGNLYITDTGNKRVLIFDTAGKFVRKIDSGVTPDRTAPTYPFDKPGELNEPIGIAVDKDGNVYVADTLNKRIQKFDAQGKPVAQWPVPGTNWEIGPFLEPFLAVDGAGNLYATAPTGKAVLKFGPDGNLLGQKRSAGDVQLQAPTGITVDDNGTVYVVDTGLNAVFNFGQVP
jgi:sugar lactone lactonase YvrE